MAYQTLRFATLFVGNPMHVSYTFVNLPKGLRFELAFQSGARAIKSFCNLRSATSAVSCRSMLAFLAQAGAKNFSLVVLI